MRTAFFLLAWLIILSAFPIAWAEEEFPSPESVVEKHFSLPREKIFIASYVLTLSSTYEGEEVLSLGGSLVFWVKYPWVRVETVGFEGVFYPVSVMDFEKGVLYSHSPERGWAKHVLSGSWLALVDPRRDPFLRRIRYSGIEEGTLGGEDVWIVRGEAKSDPLGIIPRAEVTLWIDKDTYIDHKELVLYDLYIPGFDVLLNTRHLFELTSFREVDDIPADKFSVPQDAPAMPDLEGRVFPYPAPDLRGITVKGEEISLSGLSGDVAVVFFWRMGTEIEKHLGLNLLLMEGIRERGEGKGVHVIGVTDGDPEIVAAFLEGFEAEMPTLTAWDEWAEALGVKSETACVIIDREGMVYAITDPSNVPSLLWELITEP